MIAFDNVGKAFGQKGNVSANSAGQIKWAVRGLSLEVKNGEVFGLLGPNGAGKTTVIKMMTGLLAPSEGRVLIGGHDIAASPMEAKSICGYIPDRAFLYEKLTMREHLLFIASIYGLSKDKAVARAAELLETFDIAEYGDSLIESASQGMRQRLLFALSLMHRPRILIIDEPFVGLDPFGVLLVKDILTGLSQAGVSIFLATHSLHIAKDLCHRVGLIDDGSLIALKYKEDIEGGDLEALFIKTIMDKHGP